MKLYLTGVFDGYLRMRTCKARKINKLFGYEYDPVTLKKVDGIPRYMVQQITCSADKISRLTNPQIEYIIEQVKLKRITDQSYKNEITSTIANTSANNPSDDNFSDTSDVTDYFKEEGVNDSIKEGSKKFKIIAKVDNDDDVYFYSEDKEVKKANDDSDCIHDNDSEEEMPNDSDDDGYNGYNGNSGYDGGYYYHDGKYERKTSPMMSPIISPVST